MATVHLICGPPGAGKSTYARALAEHKKGVCLSIDEWMKNLFDMDRPDPPERSWTIDRISRCEGQMWLVADELLAHGVDVVFDVGLETLAQRDLFRTRVAHTRAEAKLHYLDVGQKTQGSEVPFEPPTDDELSGAMIVSDG